MTNEVVLGPETDIFKTDLVAKDVNFIPFDKLEGEITVEAKVRYSGRPAEAVISPMEDGKVKVSFKEKQRAITKGLLLSELPEGLLLKAQRVHR